MSELVPTRDAAAGVRPPAWTDRAVALATVVLVVGVTYSLWCGSPLIWDGSYQLAETLIAGTPYAYLSRFHTLIVWQPVAWLSWHTDNVRLLTMVYGAPFLLAPVVGLLVSWWCVRRHAPMLVLWAAIGILATPLPGQIFVINDSVFQQHLFWPVFLGLMVPLTPGKRFVLGLLAFFQFAHQIGAVLTAGAAGALLVLALVERRPTERRELWDRFALVLVLAIAVGLKTVWISVPGTLLYDSYAPQEATWERAKLAWLYGVDGPPLQGLVLAYLAGLGLLAQWLLVKSGRAIRSDLFSYLAALCLLGTAAFFIYYAAVPGIWSSAINYRRWLVPLTLPVYAVAVAEMAVRRWSASRGSGAYADAVPPRSTVVVRSGVVVGLACLFTAVLGFQSTQFKRDTDRLQAEVMASPHATLPIGGTHWSQFTPLNHWGTSWQVLLLQGKRPQKWVVGGDVTEAHLRNLDGPDPKLPISSFTPRPAGPGVTGWYDLRDVIAAAVRERRAGVPGVAPPVPAP